jgi:ABC-type cobalamin/Fe3+-siderophores transport systems, ATPase components
MEKAFYVEKNKPVVILGANGAGKTRFGVKIEELNDKCYFFLRIA